MNIETQFKAPQNDDTQKGKSKIHNIECVRATPPWDLIDPYIITKCGCSSVVPIQWIAESIGSLLILTLEEGPGSNFLGTNLE
jgi:hypothetical protein